MATKQTIKLEITIADGSFEVDGSGVEYLTNSQIQTLVSNLRKRIKSRRAELRREKAQIAKDEAAALAKKEEEEKPSKADIIKATAERIAQKQKAANASAAGEVAEKTEVPAKPASKGSTKTPAPTIAESTDKTAETSTQEESPQE